jgi:hypothetical protein
MCSIGRFFMISVTEVLISHTGVMLPDCDMLYYMLEAQIFLQPPLVTHKEHSVAYSRCSTVSSAFVRTSQGSRV